LHSIVNSQNIISNTLLSCALCKGRFCSKGQCWLMSYVQYDYSVPCRIAWLMGSNLRFCPYYPCRQSFSNRGATTTPPIVVHCSHIYFFMFLSNYIDNAM
jgi:hypothetical protein